MAEIIEDVPVNRGGRPQRVPGEYCVRQPAIWLPSRYCARLTRLVKLSDQPAAHVRRDALMAGIRALEAAHRAAEDMRREAGH